MQKSIAFRIPKTENESFNIQIEELDFFYTYRHYHPEIQITAILESFGTRFIGDSISQFKAGDIYIIGPNLPHLFRNDEKYYLGNPALKAKAISIYFKKEAFGEAFLKLPETKIIQDLVLQSYKGLEVTGKVTEKIIKKMKSLTKRKGFDKLIEMFQLLNLIINSRSLTPISGMYYHQPQKEKENKRINDIFHYVIQNYNRPITLQDVAEKAQMSSTAFCRYFKKSTRHSLSGFIKEIRIGKACKMLTESSDSIQEISYGTGFNNISNFNRQFKELTGYTPSEYRKKNMEKI